MGSYSTAEGYVGLGRSNDPQSVQSFIQTQTGTSVNINNTAWCGYFAGAAVSSAGYSIPSNFASSQAWLNYGQPVSSGNVQVGDVAVFPVASSGYGHVGVVTGFDTSGNPIVLSGNVSGSVDESAQDTSNATFRRPTTEDTNPASSNSPNSSSGSGSGSGSNSNSSSDRKGSQTGNTDTPGSNAAVAASGPRCCGPIHPDTQGTPGNYKQTQIYSSVTRLPTHEPWLGHPISNKASAGTGTDNSASTSGSSGGSGGSGGAGSSGPGSGSGSTGSSGGSGTSTGGGSSAQTATPTGNYTGGGKWGTTFAQNAPIFVQRLQQDLGLTQNQALGVLGNVGGESGLVAGIQEGRPISGRGGLGWVQWTGSRRVEFEKFAADHGLSTNDPEANMLMLEHDLTGKYAYVTQALKQTSTVQQAVDVVLRKYEVPAVVVNNDQAGIAKTENARMGWANKGIQAINAAIANQNSTAQPTPSTQQPASQPAQPGTSEASKPVVPGGGTLNKNHYNPDDSFGKSTNPDAGKGTGGTTGSGSGSGGDGSNGTGTGSSSDSSSSGTGGGTSTSGGTGSSSTIDLPPVDVNSTSQSSFDSSTNSPNGVTLPSSSDVGFNNAANPPTQTSDYIQINDYVGGTNKTN